ncbi:MAG: GNAT family N-acetyltransferase [Streptococcaceae bacterium]|jgi:GNAT superfamily N-acetyltransferase|nr:GNAT family N-acetyltransferase [Streptococcaceae bacterium]
MDNIELRELGQSDKSIYTSFDKHLLPEELDIKIIEKRVRLIFLNHRPIGALRWSLFWDEIPFLNLIYIDEDSRGMGIGRQVLRLWEDEMQSFGYKMLMSSTQSDEEAQHFFRKLDYIEKGTIDFDGTPFEQAAELILMKNLSSHGLILEGERVNEA